MISDLITIFRDSAHTFEGQASGERVVSLLRRHPFFVIVRLLAFGIFCLIPIAVGIIFMPEITERDIIIEFLAASSLWYLVIWLGAFYTLMIYTLNTVILTDHRIIENEQRALFNRRISELHNSKVQDVSVRVGGFIETLLHFGDVTIQTAGADKEFTFKQVPRATEVKDLIMNTARTHV